MNYHRLSKTQKLQYTRHGSTESYIIYRCRHCRVGVIEHDRAGHLLRCQGIKAALWRHFQKGAPYQKPRRGRPPVLALA
jgi:hypothetical protein